MFNLSICIPTYNRGKHLENCLSSLIQCGLSNQTEVQICVSDNCSTDDTSRVISEAGKYLTIKYQINLSNLGFARNLLEVVQMAEGQFIWVLGDDDLLIPGAWEKVVELIKVHKLVDYFFVNSNHLATEYVQNFPQPFDLRKLPEKMSRFSLRKESGVVPFLQLINPRVSFDFLGGIYLSVFRREMWIANTHVLDKEALIDKRVCSHFDNTFPHIKIFANSFSSSLAYFSAEPLSICLTGAQEWAPMSPLVRSVRLIEALRIYKDNGLSWPAYFYFKNSALSSFFPDIVRLIINKNISGFEYVNFRKIFIINSIYPNFYLSLIYPLFNKNFWMKIRGFFQKISKIFK